MRFPLQYRLWPCADYSITNYTERPQFSAVTVSLRSGFQGFSRKPKIWTF